MVTLMMWSASVVFVLGVLLAAAPDQRAIRAARVAQNAAIMAGDPDRVASFWNVLRAAKHVE